MAVTGHGDSVVDHGLAGLDHDLPDKGLGKGLALGQLALSQKLAHVLCPCHDGLQVVLDRPALGEDRLSLLQRCLKKAPSLSIGLDPDIHVGRNVVCGLHDVPEPA